MRSSCADFQQNFPVKASQNIFMRLLFAPLPGVCVLVCLSILQSAQARPGQRVITPLVDTIYALQFSPDNRTLAIARGSRDNNRVELWDTQGGTLRHTIRGFDGTVWSVSFSPDGRTLVTGSGGVHWDKIAEKPRSQEGTFFTELKWWDPQTGDLIRRVELPGEDRVSVAAYHSPDGNLLAIMENRAALVSMFDSPLGTVGLPGALLMRRSELSADVKLLDARTGETVVKLKEGFSAYTIPVFGRRYSRPDFVSQMVTNQKRQPLLFSPDGRLVCAWNGSEIRLWNSLTGEEVRKLTNFKGRLSAVAFSPDGHTLAGAIVKLALKKNQPEYKSELRVWDIPSGTAKKVLLLTTQAISGLVFALDGQQWLVSGIERESTRSFATLELVDIQTGSVGKLTARDEGTVSSVTLSPNGGMVAFQTDASTVKLISTPDWKLRYTFNANADPGSSGSSGRRFVLSVKRVMTIAFSEATMVIGAIEQGGIKVWDARTGEVKKNLAEHQEQTILADTSANGKTTAEILDNETLHWVDTASGNENVFDEVGRQITAIALSADGQLLAIAHGAEIVFINAATRKPVRTLTASGKKVNFLTFSSSGETIAAANEDGTIDVWNLASGAIETTLHTESKITALRFARGGKMLASGSPDGKISLWDLRSRNQLMALKKHTGNVNAIAFSPDETLLASGGDDRTVVIWEFAKGKARKTLKGHDLSVTSLAFSPDATLLAVGSGNASVVIWEVQTGRLSRVLR